MSYPYDLPPANDLSLMQLDGEDCVYCGALPEAPMRPVGRLRGALVFAHEACAAEHRIA